MAKVRITAVRQIVYNDLVAQYENPIQHACNIRQGQQWISLRGERPEGMCPSAWQSMRPFVQSLARGRGNFFDGWMKNPMSAMISCNDGFRPFSFYIESIKDEDISAQVLTPSLTDTIQSSLYGSAISKEQARIYKLVLIIGNQTLPRRQIVAELGMRDNSRHTFINNYLRPAIQGGYISFAYPDSPNKPEQAYRLTAKGIELYDELKIRS